MRAAFEIFPVPWLHFICLYSPHIMSPPSNLQWFLPCVFHLSNAPHSKLHLLFTCFLHLQCLPLFNLHFVFHFFCIVMCSSFRFAFSNSIFLALLLHFLKMKYPRANTIRQHKCNIICLNKGKMNVRNICLCAIAMHVCKRNIKHK